MELSVPYTTDMQLKIDRKIVLIIAVFLISNIGYAQRVSCKSFDDQAEAQRYFEAKKKGWKSLDRDKDREACECLKGGSSYGDGRCRNWRKKNNKS